MRMYSGCHYCATTVQTVLVRYAVWNVASSGLLLESGEPIVFFSRSHHNELISSSGYRMQNWV